MQRKMQASSRLKERPHRPGKLQAGETRQRGPTSGQGLAPLSLINGTTRINYNNGSHEEV